MTFRQEPAHSTVLLVGGLGALRDFRAQQRQKRKYYCKFLPSAFCKSNFPCLRFLPPHRWSRVVRSLEVFYLTVISHEDGAEMVM